MIVSIGGKDVKRLYNPTIGILSVDLTKNKNIKLALDNGRILSYDLTILKLIN